MIITPEDSRWLNSLANVYRTEVAQTPVSLQESQAKNLYNIIEGIQTALQVDLSEAQVDALISALSEGWGWVDKLQNIADVVGIVDPTGIVDLANAGVSVLRGTVTDRDNKGEHLSNAGLRAVSAIPYAGDAIAKPVLAAKGIKGTRIASGIEKALPIIKSNPAKRIAQGAKRQVQKDNTGKSTLTTDEDL